MNDDDHHVLFDFDPDILEESCGEQRLDRLRCLFFGKRFSHLYRQIAKDGTGFGTLNSFDPNILDRKGFKRQYRRRKQADDKNGQQ